MIVSVAWRNIWRNPLRSGVIITAITLGMFAGVFSAFFMKGWMNQRLEAGVETEVSHITANHPEYRENYEISKYIPNGTQITSEFEQEDIVNGVSPRISIQSMVSSAETGTGVKIMGVYPEKEKTVTNLYTKIAEGAYFEGVKRNPIVIGEKLAKKLKVKLRSKVVITLQDAKGNITGGAFRVCGIFDTSNSMFEEGNVFVRYNDLKNLASLPDGATHEIIVHLENQDDLFVTTDKLADLYQNLEVKNWKQLVPELGLLTEMGDMYTYMLVIIILLSLGFGIVNTMLMVVLERVKEIGMLMAIGMSKIKVFAMLMLETVLLTLTGGTIGVFLGFITASSLKENGINLSRYAQGLEELGYDPVIYPVIESGIVSTIIFLVIFTGILASIYPARKALKYNPAEAIRTE